MIKIFCLLTKREIGDLSEEIRLGCNCLCPSISYKFDAVVVIGLFKYLMVGVLQNPEKVALFYLKHPTEILTKCSSPFILHRINIKEMGGTM